MSSVKEPDTNVKTAEVSMVSIKLPSFYQEDPQGWFLQAEAQFGICGVTADDTHYWYVMAALDAETTSHVGRTLKSTAPGKKFPALEDFLLAAFTPSK